MNAFASMVQTIGNLPAQKKRTFSPTKNAALIVELLTEHGPMKRAQLAKMSGLSVKTLTNLKCKNPAKFGSTAGGRGSLWTLRERGSCN